MEESIALDKVEISGNFEFLKFRFSKVEEKNERLGEEMKRLKDELELSVEKFRSLRWRRLD